tara:strand:+ start:598 stop:942 length:345 start_codon:yes stop_codon:yes gene_type:complete
MSNKNLKKELELLKSRITTANRLYYLLILYSDENIPLPNDRNMLKGKSSIALKYNIYQMEEYVKDVDLINEKLMKNFNNMEYSLKKEDLDYLTDWKDISISSININDIPEYDIL